MLFRRPVKFEELALEILETKRLRAKGTRALAAIVLGRLTRYFGGYRLSEVTEKAWADYVSERLRERPGRKLFDDKKYMTQVMLEAYRRGLVERRIRLYIPDPPTSAGREITPDELSLLLRHASSELRFQIEIAAKMGLRLREMLYLRWDQLDWERRTIRFLPADTKTRRGREVPISPDLLARFTDRFAARVSPYVFPSKTAPAKPQHENKSAWRRCKRLAGVRCRWHDLRHTCASQLLRKGISPIVVARFLGMSERVLARIYSHTQIDDLRKAVAAISDGTA